MSVPAIRHFVPAGILIVAASLPALAAEDATVGEPKTWDFRSDYSLAGPRENRVPDAYGDVAWHLLRTSASDGPIESRKWLRDGNYVPLDVQADRMFNYPIDGWIFRGPGQYLAPFVGLVTEGYKAAIEFQAEDTLVAPGPDHAVVVGWQSPADITVQIEGHFEHGQTCSGVNSQVNWYVQRGPAPQAGAEDKFTELAAGISDYGVESASGKFQLADVSVKAGEFIYFIVDARADGTASPHACDGTRFNVTITGGETGPPPHFETDVLPILVASCHDCHGEDAQEAQLDLRTLAGMIRGGENGASIVPGVPQRSYLLKMIVDGEMPPDDPLPKEQVALIRRWIQHGAAADEDVSGVRPRSLVSEQDRQHWAFRKAALVEPPEVQAADRVRTPVDNFLLAELEARGLSYSPDADRITLVRRAYMNLIGLPPSPDEVRQFLDDDRPDAYKQLVDRLLQSPHYGERWGRHWLDAAGYVDVRLFDGDLGTIYFNEGMWRFRDYIIKAFNQDKPYDRLLIEQLAGDEIVEWESTEQWTDEIRDSLVATSYLRNIEDATSEAQYGIKKRYDMLYDLMEMVSTSTLGLTLQCARCHSHKYDPIPQRDYFRWMACFETAYNVHSWLKPAQRQLPASSPAERKEIDTHNASLDQQLAPLREELKQLEGKDDEASQARKKELNGQIAAIEKQRRKYGVIQALWDNGSEYTSHLQRRGNYAAPGAPVEPGFLEVLSGPDNQLYARPPETREGSSGRRLALAQWLTDGEGASGALVARVMVNRVWQNHFGVGLVDTPGNFGRSGSPPTHPELLEYLVADFIQHGWSINRLHRLIMNSTAYRQVSDSFSDDPGSMIARAEEVDPENRLLWRMNLRRLEAEIVRDAILMVSGNIDLTAGGPPVKISNPPSGLSAAEPGKTGSGHLRRSIYLLNRRIYPLKLLEIFDAPIMPVNCTRRVHSATVLQSLAILNDPFIAEQAKVMADRVAALAGDEDPQRIETIYQLALVRGPTADEAARCLAYLADQQQNYAAVGSDDSQPRQQALADLCQTILCTNEFLYVE